MKSYVDYIDEIDKNSLYQGLLGYGMFTDKLPPCFTSKKFYDYCLTRTNGFKKKAYRYVYYESIRNVNVPRQMGIPTPMSYQRLCECLANNWDKLHKHFSDNTVNQKYKVSRIHIRKMYDKNNLFEMNYSNWKVDGTPDPELSIGMKYMVKADISKCFPSIYTHSVTWALVGKTKAKANRRGNWYNEIDSCLQNTKDQETHGLLIGPHSSNIVSELILCVIDNNLVDRGWKYIRNIDDYTCYVEDELKASEFLVDLQNELRQFDLSLNHKKTRIEKLPLASVEQWARKINSIALLTNYNKVDYKNCRAYIDFAIETARKEKNNAAVLKYAIKVLSGLELTENAKIYEQQEVFMLALIYPYMVPLLEKYIFEPCETSVNDIKSISNLIFKEYFLKLKYEAVSYAIYFAIKYSFEIEEMEVDKIIKTDDCILLTLGFKYYESRGDSKAVKKMQDYAESFKNDEDKFEELWIFGYEILPETSLKKDWVDLKQNNVSFIKF